MSTNRIAVSSGPPDWSSGWLIACASVRLLLSPLDVDRVRDLSDRVALDGPPLLRVIRARLELKHAQSVQDERRSQVGAQLDDGPRPGAHLGAVRDDAADRERFPRGRRVGTELSNAIDFGNRGGLRPG